MNGAIDTSLGTLSTGARRLDEIVAGRGPWSGRVRRGEQLSIIDLGGNQAVDFLVHVDGDHPERYSAADTIVDQGSIFLTTGSVLRSNEDRR